MAADVLQQHDIAQDRRHVSLGCFAREKVKAIYGWANKLAVVDALLDS